MNFRKFLTLEKEPWQAQIKAGSSKTGKPGSRIKENTRWEKKILDEGKGEEDLSGLFS